MNFLSKMLFGIFYFILGLFVFWVIFFLWDAGSLELVVGRGFNQYDLTPFFVAVLVFLALASTGGGIYYIIVAFLDSVRERHTQVIHGQTNIMNYTCPRCGINLIPGTTVCPYCGTRTGGYPVWHGR